MAILAKKPLDATPPPRPFIGTPLRVLVVDDDETNRTVLELLLRQDGHEVCAARDGAEAVALYEELRPDLILMDVMMPGIDGYEATRDIKNRAGDDFVAVIFITALADDEVMARCLEAGGDDFLSKPVSRMVLRAKVAAAARIHGLYTRLARKGQELGLHHERLRYEHEIAEQVFAKIVGSTRSGAPNVRSELLPLAITNGDLLLVAQTPGGAQHILLGDCTGHGLSAAIGAIPVTDIFYAMARKGFGVGEIVSEMNRKLHATLPTGQFLAACMVAWEPAQARLQVWNGGLPDALLVPARGGLIRLPSRNLPLGIAEEASFTVQIETRRVEEGDRLLLYSDGLVDAADPSGRMFGGERLEAMVAANRDRAALFDELRAAAAAFRADQPQDDDISLVEVLCEPARLQRVRPGPNMRHQYLGCAYSLRLGPRALASFDPMELVKLLCAGMPVLESHRSPIFTVIMELYNNALEHGVLRLDGALKENADSFGEYYSERERRLASLAEGWIHIEVECRGDERGGELILQIEDSGHGFAAGPAATGDLLQISGRGMSLVQALCAALSYDGRGNYVRAVYAW